MMLQEASKEAMSLLPMLEPVLGAALAFNLAYLNLDPFRYRDKIRQETLEILVKRAKSIKPQINDKKWFKELCHLAEVNENFEKNKKQASGPTIRSKAIPNSLWAFFYKWILHGRRDYYVSAAATLTSLVLLILGAGHSVGIFKLSMHLFTQNNIGWTFTIAIFCLIAPIAFVCMGIFTVTKAKTFAEYQLGVEEEETIKATKDKSLAVGEQVKKVTTEGT